MSNAEIIQPNFQLPYPSDIEDGETLREYAIRTKTECEAHRERVAALKDGISSIALVSGDSDKVIEICSVLLSEV
jgi:putative NIF3 family GTP cyclohydrolase 1 type 2